MRGTVGNEEITEFTRLAVNDAGKKGKGLVVSNCDRGCHGLTT